MRKLQFAVEVFFSGAEVDWLVAWLAARMFVFVFVVVVCVCFVCAFARVCVCACE